MRGCTRPSEARRDQGGGSRRTPFEQPSNLRVLELVPIKLRYIVPRERRDGAQSRRIEPVKITSEVTVRPLN